MALGRSRRNRTQFIPPKLQITSMMDMFTIILIFLLFSFSNDIQAIKIDKDIQLPKSSAQTDYSDTLRLVVSQDKLWLGDEIVDRIEDGKIIGLSQINVQDSNLYQKLCTYREKTLHGGKGEAKSNQILFLCDRRLSFRTINNVIKTASMAGFPNFQFGVLKQ
ncbi:MAG: biopolymer transporter ExbD [Deltaproteobacteria bacterium]|nr:biopolymer transporter ExbD [Deltaproteobacteria bacterium]